MKTTKFAKISLLVLSAALILGAVFAMSISAETAGPEIISQNMAYSNEFKIMYAVDAASVPDGGAVTLKVYTKDPTVESSEPVATMTAEAATPAAETGNLNKDAYIFITETGVSYADMTLNFFAQAEANGVKGAVKRYSVAEYFFEKLADTETDAEKKVFYQRTLEFGTGVQMYAATPTVTGDALISNLRYVVVEGGKIDGYSTGLYPIGKELTPVADTETTEKWAATVLYADNNETVTNDLTSFKVIDAAKTTFTLGYKEPPFAINYRPGTLTFDEYAAGTLKIHSNSVTELVSDDSIHKNAFKMYLGASSKFNINLADVNDIANSGIEAANATGIELSFDMKVEILKPTPDKDQPIHLLFVDGANNWPGVRLYVQDTSNTNNIYLSPNELPSGSFGHYVNNSLSDAGVPAIDTVNWFHFRMVQFNDNIVYIYLNNALVGKSTGSSMTDIANVVSCIIRTEVDNPMNVYMDNFFFGYITDAVPAN